MPRGADGRDTVVRAGEHERGLLHLRDPEERRPRGDRDELPPVAEGSGRGWSEAPAVAAESTANGSPSGEPHPKFVAASTSRVHPVGCEAGQLLRDRSPERVPEDVELLSRRIGESSARRSATWARSRMVRGRRGVLEPPVPGASNAIVRCAERGPQRLPRLERRAEPVAQQQCTALGAAHRHAERVRPTRTRTDPRRRRLRRVPVSAPDIRAWSVSDRRMGGVRPSRAVRPERRRAPRSTSPSRPTTIPCAPLADARHSPDRRGRSSLVHSRAFGLGGFTMPAMWPADVSTNRIGPLNSCVVLYDDATARCGLRPRRRCRCRW